MNEQGRYFYKLQIMLRFLSKMKSFLELKFCEKQIDEMVKTCEIYKHSIRSLLGGSIDDIKEIEEN